MSLKNFQKRPPGPRPFNPLGSLPTYLKDPIKFFIDNAKKYGDMYKARFGVRVAYFVHRPDLIHEVLVSQYKKCFKGDALRRNRPLLGEGLLTSEGERWLKDRRQAQPYFSQAHLDSYLAIVKDSVQRRIANWTAGRLNVQDEMYRIAVDVVGKSLFASESIDAQALGEIFQAVSAHYLARITKLLPILLQIQPRESLNRYRAAVAQCDAIVARIIRNYNVRDRETLLGFYLEALKSGAVSETLVRDHIITFLFAGHETTALAASYALHLLAHHPMAQQKLRNEITTLGKTARLSRLADGSLPYLSGVIDETLRLYPPVWALSRKTTQPFVLNGFLIKAGSDIVMLPLLSHRDPRYFTDPDVFLPERWTQEFVRSLPDCTYFPFGMGPRMCMGEQFSRMELSVILAETIARFSVNPVGPKEVEIAPTITLHPKNPIEILIEPLSQTRSVAETARQS